MPKSITLTEKAIERFWKKVGAPDPTTGCMEWQGSRHYRGYGKVTINKSVLFSHRVAWTIVNGDIPSELHVCHACDNPRCCNPAHLWLGTHLNNQQDKARKGRAAHQSGTMTSGKLAPRTKLNPQQVHDIKIALSKGVLSQDSIAKLYGVGRSTIKNIKLGKTWRYID